MADIWIENRTSFVADSHVEPNADGQEVVVVIFSATFQVETPGAILAPAPEQLPIAFSDVPFGDPNLSSTRYEADIATVKPVAEFVINGVAHAPDGKAVREMQVGFRIGALRKVLNIVGDRVHEAGGYSAPRPFMKMPVVYERAYGGTAPDGNVEVRNPVGVGYRNAISADPAVRSEAPNVTYPNEPFLATTDRPAPAGFGAIGRGWQPRLKYAGTFDANWLASQWPLPPKDYDPRHNMCTPVDQQLPAVSGGENVTVVGMTPSGRWDFRLPVLTVPVRLIYEDRSENEPLRIDTVLIEPDNLRVTLKARIARVTRRNSPALREVIFGHVTPAFLIARRKGKKYFDPRGGNGTIAGRPTWQS
ncbi:DUF2169 domain-containing protein [Mesorhizobium caraganae]|uniref:DUF2169 domain-containing protein n=1 Tax=Mesorhizobium caraganae TaxID=483206 RepID=A0ABV1YWL8_9HYPH